MFEFEEEVTKLDLLVGAAITDPQLRDGLLDGKREAIGREWGLTKEEQAALLSIQARTLSDLAQALFSWRQSRKPWAAMPSRPACG